MFRKKHILLNVCLIWSWGLMQWSCCQLLFSSLLQLRSHTLLRIKMLPLKPTIGDKRFQKEHSSICMNWRFHKIFICTRSDLYREQSLSSTNLWTPNSGSFQSYQSNPENIQHFCVLWFMALTVLIHEKDVIAVHHGSSDTYLVCTWKER